MLERLMPKALHYVEAVAQQGSVQKASRELHISASAVIRQVILLEEELHVVLFERHAHGMRITPAGQMFVDMARDWQRQIEQVWSKVKEMQGESFGHLRLATMDSLVNGVLPVFLDRLARQYPKVIIGVDVVSPDGAVEALRQGAADIALAFNITQQRDLKIVWSADLPLGGVVAREHELARREFIMLADLAKYPIAAQNGTLSIRRYLDSHHKWLFSDCEPPLATNSLQLVKQMALRGSHVALTSEIDAAPEILNGDLVFRPIKDKGAVAQSICTAVYPHRVLPRVAWAVAELLSETTRIMLNDVRDDTLAHHRSLSAPNAQARKARRKEVAAAPQSGSTPQAPRSRRRCG